MTPSETLERMMNPKCKHGTPVAQTQCKYCLNDEVIELRSKLGRLEAERDEQERLKTQAQTVAMQRGDELTALSSRLSSVSAELAATKMVKVTCEKHSWGGDDNCPYCRLDQYRLIEDYFRKHEGETERGEVRLLLARALGENQQLQYRLDSVRNLLELDIDDDRRWDEMAKLFPGAEVKAATVQIPITPGGLLAGVRAVEEHLRQLKAQRDAQAEQMFGAVEISAPKTGHSHEYRKSDLIPGELVCACGHYIRESE